MKENKVSNEYVYGKPFCLILLSVIFLIFATTAILPAHMTGDEALKGVGLDEKLNARVPLDLEFVDQEGKTVRLGQYFTGQPVILSLNYYTCPMLCPLTFHNLINTMEKMQGLSLNRDYRIVTVSIDPGESKAAMREKARETYSGLKWINDPRQRWTFLMGTSTSIHLLTSTVGFRYVQLEKNNFAHPSVFIVLTPDGRVSRYLYGIEIAPSDLKLALIEATDGRIGSSRVMNRVLLYCFHYDPAGRKYAVTAVNLMKIAGGAVLAMLVILIAVLIRSEKRKPEVGEGS